MIKRILGCLAIGASVAASSSLLAHHSVAGAYDLASVWRKYMPRIRTDDAAKSND